MAKRRLFLVVSALAVSLALLGALGVYATRPSLPSAPLSGPVVGISDGDTLTVLVDQSPVKVRLWGIDTPEKTQAYGAKAKLALSEMAFGKQAVVEVRDIDRYGRSVGWVTVAGKPINLALVQLGMAWWYQKFAPRADDLRDAEAKARAAKLGLWADPEPQPPWLFRKDRKR